MATDRHPPAGRGRVPARRPACLRGGPGIPGKTEPNESCILMCGEVGRHLIEGHLRRLHPGIFARHRRFIDEIVGVESDTAIGEMRRLARELGCSWARARARTWSP